MLTVACLIEAVVGIAVGRENGDLVSSVLQPHSGINDEPLSSAYAEVWVEEDNVLLLLVHVLGR